MSEESRKKKDPRPPLGILIEVGKKTKPTLADVELAIKEKLAAQATDLFRNTETVVIVLQDEGNHPGDGGSD
jgi:hypothetical protein